LSILRGFVGQARRETVWPKAKGAGVAAERRRGPVSQEIGDCRRGRAVVIRRRGRLTRPRGSRDSFGGHVVCGVASGRLRATARVRSFGVGRVRGSKVREGLWRGEDPRRAAAGGAGQLESSRTDSQREQSFEAGEAGGSDRLRCVGPRATGRRASARRKGTHSRRGSLATARSRVGVGETGGDKDPGGAIARAGG
jgi:hypothetical protein